MAKPKNKDVLARYRTELERSKKWRQHEGYDQQWNRLIDLYRGRHWQRYVNEDRIVVNMTFATINVIAPSISVNNPKITVNSRQEETASSAVITEQVVNYHWRHQKFQPQIRRAVNDMLMVGHGWVKIGYAYKEAPPESGIPDDEELDEDAVPAHEDEPEGYPCAETLTVKRVDRPFVERVSFKDIFVDPDASDPTTLRWICQRVRRPLGDVRRDTRYLAPARRDAEADSKDHWDADDSRNDENKGLPFGGFVDVYEFYDLVANKVCTFTCHGDSFLIAPKPIPLPYANPFIMFRDYDVPDQFYPMGELEAIEVLQYELNETRTQQINHRKQFNPKHLYREDVFPSQEHLDALKDNAYNAMVPVAAEGLASLQDAIIAMPTTQPPPEFYAQSQIIQSDMDMITGVSDYMRGQMPEIRRTATEAALIQDGQQARAADKLAKIEATTAEIAEHVVQMLQTFTTGDQVALVTGINGIKLWVHYDREAIAGEFLFEVEAGSTQPNNETFRRQSALQMVDALTPFIDAGVINMPAAASYIINTGFGVKNASHLVQLPPPPPAEMPQEGMGPPMVPGLPPDQGMPPEGMPPEGMPPPEMAGAY